MVRYARYKRYYKKVYPRKRWASNIKYDSIPLNINTTDVSASQSIIICENSTAISTPTPTILRFARFRMKGDIRTTATNASNVTSASAFILFVPEGMDAGISLLEKHPEYILGWTTMSMDSGNSFSITSPLKRNLNSGDSIQVLFTIDTSQSPSANVQYNIYYTVQYWTATS